jgi:hypothetical protein
MSVTFWVEDDATWEEKFECQCVWGGSDPQPGCLDCKGTGWITFQNDVHSMNLANGNARNFLAALGENDEELCGRFEVSQFPALRRCILRLRNSQTYRQHYSRERVEVANGKGARLILSALPPEQLAEYAERFQRLLDAAETLGNPVHYG